ncbi:helix-turn-helix domain-containing protein [Tropicimonas isoalkanivorans]|uniref:Helix-turn-helix domain-containing protein n=1 Tax=Tropicimonas isoalkanivorans TaxID=441112 RepID=A0A1I1GT68_9RHOB|nr:helix-turn-helix domain-containing protein [Tropicimonas isoalkanivorans]SFC12230.1 Helix-turn-helix domain-containing protein [Tropicimonas isoalkanivorans]
MDDTSDWYSAERATFGDRVAGAREALGMSQDDLAKRLGVKLKTVRGWENDMNEPRANKLQMLSGILGVSLMWLLNGEGDGLDGPVEDEAPLVPEIRALLLEMRQIRSEVDDAAARLARVEKSLRATLKETHAE